MASSNGADVTGQTLPQMPTTMITDLSADALSRIMVHLKENGWQRDDALDEVAALRSTCHSLRLATDLLVTHANLHRSIDATGMRSIIRRCSGDRRATTLML
jgi:hypothetical protein